MKLSTTLLPPGREGRYKRVMSTVDVIRVFVNRTQPEARSNNCYADDGVLMSYSTPIARWCVTVPPYEDRNRFILYADSEGFSVTTKTKHLCPLVRHLGTVIAFRVDDVMADTAAEHSDNFAARLAECEKQCLSAARGPKGLRKGKSEWAASALGDAFGYARFIGLPDVPDDDMPKGVLADWLREHMSNLVGTIKCVASLCPITGKAL